MKILIYCKVFYPSVGGMEIFFENLARELVKMGNEVVFITETLSDQIDQFEFPVFRKPSFLFLAKWILWSDVFLNTNPFERTAGWVTPVIFFKKWFIAHQDETFNWYYGRKNEIKKKIMKQAGHIAISKYIAGIFPFCCRTIPDAYNQNIFKILPQTKRTEDLIFVGRIVPEKGLDTLLVALRILHVQNILCRLTVAGDGPERSKMQEKAQEYGLSKYINFIGFKKSVDLAPLLNQHQILVVPSAYKEALGIVAMEGIACGCVVVGSAGGGLSEAIGSCGLLFPNGDSFELAERIKMLLNQPEKISLLRKNYLEHLAKFTIATIAESYFNVFETFRKK